MGNWQSTPKALGRVVRVFGGCALALRMIADLIGKSGTCTLRNRFNITIIISFAIQIHHVLVLVGALVLLLL